MPVFDLLLIFSSTENETCPNLVHLPAPDELSLNPLLQQFVKDYTTPDKCNNKNDIFKHWSHDEHVLKLITSNEVYKHEDEILCEGCVKPILTDDGLSYYGCAPCKYFMHQACAELPRKIEHHLWSGTTKLYANKYIANHSSFSSVVVVELSAMVYSIVIVCHHLMCSVSIFILDV
ncbi:hypothetical protein POM88_043272 [Heracleum sosnowskyi]|uniref:DC1 domain-containing protein n=1 Tax=Heracleum sosnowskyi TaxID=360622 RepID=A0AAD8H328_9APIA|nr:hypothetical protein POM88_043272 [Heracleum sosnowskyi]